MTSDVIAGGANVQKMTWHRSDAWGENDVNVFRSLLVAMFVGIALYTSLVVARHGFALLPVFFGDIAKMAWPGQFNFDFLCMLTLSGLWVAWRHRFSGPGLLLGTCALFGGAFFLTAYLFVESYRAGGDVRRLLLGAPHDRM